MTETTITKDDALARLITWTSAPSDAVLDALVQAALVAEDALDTIDSPAASARLEAAAKAYRADVREMAYQSNGRFGGDVDASHARLVISTASRIVEVEGDGMSAMMLRARGCGVACLQPDGRWVGFGTEDR